MANLSPIQPAFSGGEWSPRAAGRVDLDGYKRALARCENFEPLPQGSLFMRAGSGHVRALVGNAAEQRLIQFRFTDEQDFFLLLRDRSLQIFDANGNPVGYSSGGGAVGGYDLVLNGGFTDGLYGWTVPSGTVEIQFAGSPYVSALFHEVGAKLRQQRTASAVGAYRFQFSVNGLGAVADALRARIGTTPGGGELYDGTFGLPVNPEDPVTRADVMVNIPAPGAVYIDFERVGAWTVPLAVDSVSLVAPATAEASRDAPWSGAQVKDVHYAVETGADRVVFACRGVQPASLQRTSGGNWAFSTIDFGAGTPEGWMGTNWPETVAFYAGRTWWGLRNRFWASRAPRPVRNGTDKLIGIDGGPFDLSLTTDVGGGVMEPLPGDGIDAKALTPGAIRWFCSRRQLLMGTDLGEHSITGSRGTPLVGDVQVVDEDGVGSARTQAVDAGPYALHVSGDRRQVRALAYEDQTGWNSIDLTFLADHITAPLVKELHFTRTPTGIILLLLEDGTLAAATWEPAQKVVAWARFGIAGGVVRTAAVSRGPAGAWLWLVVERSNGAHLERMPLSERSDAQFLDGWTVGAVGAPGSAVPHLAGLPVAMFVAGEYRGSTVAGVDGSVPLWRPEDIGKPCVIGATYRAVAKLLPLEGGNPEGTSQGMVVRYTDISARLNDSAAPLLNGERASEEKPFATVVRAPGDRITGDVKAKSLQIEEGGIITIEQDLPFRTEVCAVSARAVVSKV